MIKILQKESPVLRQKSKEVLTSEISSEKIKKILKKMQDALDSQDDGVAIAAPQIGELWRIFIVSGKVKQILELSKNNPDLETDFTKIKKEKPDEIYINPVIIKKSRKTEMMEEGCLSVRWLYGKVKRAEKVSIEAYNEKGERIRRGASGLLAQIFQHEIDHLDGILFIDKAQSIEEILPEQNT